jgi:hypothetical protein
MDDFGQDHDGEGFFNAFLHPIRRIRRLRHTWSHGRVVPLEEDQDGTVIEGESVNQDIQQPEHYVTCGHNPRGNPTAQCRCGAIVCDRCIKRCPCGDALCPTCAITDPETGQTFCRLCLDDLIYRRRAAAVGHFFLSLFVNVDNCKNRGS